MWLDELSQLVDALATCIDTHRDVLNESTTRYALIDPLLSALGWCLSDPAQVRTEYTIGPSEDATKTRRLDYAMWQDEKICLVVEAKRFGGSLALDDGATAQAITYCYTSGCQHFLVTDGNQWHGYALMGEGELKDRRMLSFTVKERRRNVMDLFWLWPGNFKGATTQPNLHAPSVREIISRSTTPSPIRQHTTTGVPLPEVEVRYEKGIKPHRLVFPDGETKDVSNRWWRVQAATAEWLIESNRVKHLPVQTGQNVTLLHKKRQGFVSPKEVRGHWFEGNGSAIDHLRKARQLLFSCDVNPSEVHVELS